MIEKIRLTVEAFSPLGELGCTGDDLSPSELEAFQALASQLAALMDKHNGRVPSPCCLARAALVQ